jgi:glycosyltransferase involved in cell wall biosynthesis
MLVFVKKGRDVDATIKLVEELRLTRRVVWVDEMKREQLFTFYNAALIVFGQFGTPVFAFSALEPLTQATPCISYFLDGLTEGVPFYDSAPAIFISKDPDVIADYLARLMSNKDIYKKACHDAWLWIENNCLETVFAESLTSTLNNSGFAIK